MKAWYAFRVWLLNAFIASKSKPISRKLVKSIITSACVYAIAFVVAKLGYKQSVADTAVIAQVAAMVGAFVSGWLTTELPGIVVDDTQPVTVPVRDPEPVSASPEPLLTPVPSRVKLQPGTGFVKTTSEAPEKPAEPAPDADTVTMPAVSAEAAERPLSAETAHTARRRYHGPEEVGPRTVV